VPGVVDLQVVRDEAARQYRLSVGMRDGAIFSSRVLSDGTLRVLALLSLLHDPRRRGVICFEEPENGIHEARIPGLIELLRSFCTDLSRKPADDQPLTQIIVNTHSPVVMQCLQEDEIIAADVVSTFEPSTERRSRKTRMRSGVVDQLPLGQRDKGVLRLTRHEIEQLIRRDKELLS
jgi:predicted ATPase